MSTSNERVRLLRTELNLTMETFGAELGVSRAAISNIENGNRSLTNQMAGSICNKFGVSEEWLKSGTGNMFIQTANDAVSKFALENGLYPMEETLIREYLKLRDDERAVFRKYLKHVLSELTADEEPTIDEKVASYRAELEAEAANSKLGASQTGNGKEA